MQDKKIDLLSRNEFVENIIKLVQQLSENRQGCCFAIEGGWGIGKTFVIKKLEENLRIIQNEEINDDKYFVFNYNCWKYDYYEEPAVAIVSAMLSSIEKDKTVIGTEIDSIVNSSYHFVMRKLTEIAGLYIKNKIGINLVEWVANIKEIEDDDKEKQHEFDKMFNFNQTIEEVRNNLIEIAKERTLVLIVDELDRCIPQYAIKILERIHHIFSGLENIIIIMAIDRAQLEHSIEEMFGANQSEKSMNVEKYLKKFIDFSIMLDGGKINENLIAKYEFYFEKFFTNNHLKDEDKIVEIVSKLFSGIDIRIQEKLMQKIDIIHSIVCKGVVDSSVIIFEILYEVLKMWNFGDLKYLTLISRKDYPELKRKLGEENMKLLKSMESEAVYCNELIKEDSKVYIADNIYGNVFWYFACIFNKDKMPYYDRNNEYEGIDKELLSVKKYCEFSEIMC